MNSKSVSLICILPSEKMSVVLIFISFFLGVIFFSRIKHTGFPVKTLDHKERDLIEMEQSFFLNNSEEIIRH